MKTAALLLPLLWLACGDDDDSAAPDAGPSRDAGLDAAVGPDASLDGGTDAGADGGDVEPCERLPGDPDRARFVVVSHPYDEESGPASSWEVLSLSSQGALDRPGITFEMGRAVGGTIAFTADGVIGLAPQEDGTLGIFTIDEAGEVEVLYASFFGSFYVESVVIDPTGSRAWVVDPNWPENGGGLYPLDIGCDGTVEAEGIVLPTKNAHALWFLDVDRALVAAESLLSSTAGDDLHLLVLGEGAQVVSGADVFGDDEAIVSSMAVTHDGRHALVGDANAFAGIPNRIGVASIDGDVLLPVQVVTPVEDPTAILASPQDDAVLVASGFGDAVFALAYAPDAATPFAPQGEVAYQGAGPQLPAAAVMIERGALEGHVLLAENVAVRQLELRGAGVVDLGPTVMGEGTQNIVGAIGVQP